MTFSIYLDSSTISKRYIIEKGTDTTDFIFDECEIENTKIYFSMWNIGEVLGVFDKYYNSKKISKEIFEETLRKFLVEIQKLNKLKTLKLIPLNSNVISKAIPLIFKYHIYQADAIQISSFEISKCEIFISADKRLVDIMKSINKMSFNIETEENSIKNIISADN